VVVGKLRWLTTQLRRAPTGTIPGTSGNGQGCEHVLGTNMSGANMYQAPTSGRQLQGANLTLSFSKNTPKLPFLVEEAQMNFFNTLFALSTKGSCPRLLGEHLQKNSQNLTARIVRELRLKWKGKLFSLVPGRDSRV
jgi:hypothetical protein